VAFFQPFSVVDQSKVIQSEYNGEMAKIKVMVDTGNVDWDVVQIEGPDLMRGCEEGMYERLDWTRLGHADQLIPEAAQECGSAALVWSVAIAYDTDKLARPPPHGRISGTCRKSPANAACANARCTTWSSPCWPTG
jgi:putative spermidine/putrescine transport system substrate-binding protein